MGQNTPYITKYTKQEFDAMIALNGLDNGRLYKITDLRQHVMATSTNSYVIINEENLPAWDYEGVMVAGESSVYSGWSIEGGFTFGSINPTPVSVSGYLDTVVIITNATTLYIYDITSNAQSCNEIEINGVSYTGFDEYGLLSISGNIFVNGQSYNIKLK